ncbi:MAG: ribosomal subunit interface protein [Candidatus Vogelbacteria bacterium GWA1_51_14]|uniref:Ribosomal subunit interface protein n=1 Tax=Candidatus Vogelbacteria bacterium GWA1_51_14 TaxID=1802435 RepID=A0A1G2QAZ0_9BACT|nr:MAG: ribosomal subunit interface protein [Candidatus Vogelbacteria bacterium GWA1_51_14]
MIQTEIKATALELTPAIKNYLEAKILTLDKFVDSSTGGVLVDVELAKTTGHHHLQGEIFKAEINLQVNGSFYRASVTKEDLYAAIDEMKDEIIRQITEKKSKKQTLFKKGARRLKGLLRGWGK